MSKYWLIAEHKEEIVRLHENLLLDVVLHGPHLSILSNPSIAYKSYERIQLSLRHGIVQCFVCAGDTGLMGNRPVSFSPSTTLNPRRCIANSSLTAIWYVQLGGPAVFCLGTVQDRLIVCSSEVQQVNFWF